MNEIKKLQQFDSLEEAGKLSGKSYKEDESTVWLGMALQMDKSEKLNALLDKNDDTKFSEKTEEYIRKIQNFGFTQLLKEDFITEKGNESFFIFWHEDYSILLSFDTFWGNRNGGKFYYNWSPNTDNTNGLTSTGGYRGLYWKDDFSEELINPEPEPKWADGMPYDEYKVLSNAWYERDKKYRKDNVLRRVWVGNHDCREAVKNNISLLAENGTFLKTWKEAPFLWLLHHGDTKVEGYDYEAINKERFDKLPEHVRNCIGNLK